MHEYYLVSYKLWGTACSCYQGLDDPVPEAASLDEKNALALAIVPVGEFPRKFNVMETLTFWMFGGPSFHYIIFVEFLKCHSAIPICINATKYFPGF